MGQKGSKMNFLLLGKTGEGKSATGNSLLERNVFKASANVTSETKKVAASYGTFNDLTLLVVDGPGLEDTEKTSYQDKKSAAKNMDKALALCDGGIDSFIFVLKFGSRFTDEYRSALETHNRIFGPKYLDYMIVVLTHGDMFDKMKEREKLNISFQEWCKQQTGDFHQLYINCKGRFVLFDNYETNSEKKRTQIERLVKLAQEIKKKNGRYTSKCFVNAKREREKMIVEAHAPELKEETQEKVSLFSADIEKYAKAPTETKRRIIEKEIKVLKEQIKKEDDGHGVLHEILQLVEQVSENMDDVNKLLALAKEAEEMRKSESSWTFLEVVCVVVGGVLCLAASPLIVAAVGIAAVVEMNEEKKKEKAKNTAQY